jgi:hypothetical protein
MFVTVLGSSCLFRKTRLDSRIKECGADGKSNVWAKFTYPRSFGNEGDRAQHVLDDK